MQNFRVMQKIRQIILFLITISCLYFSEARAQNSGISMPQWIAPGYTSIEDYIAKNLKYPEDAKNKGIQGTVMVTVVIDTSGLVTDAAIDQDPGHGMGAEALRVIKSLPPLKPALHNGNPVRMHMKFPVNFKIQKEEDQDSIRKVNKIFEEMPDVDAQFPGGDAAMQKFIADHLNLPKDAEFKGIINISADIEADGAISNVKPVKPSIPSLDDEAVRVIKSMPPWIPAKKFDKNVKTTKIIPVRINQ
jgi:TonB family protein